MNGDKSAETGEKENKSHNSQEGRACRGEERGVALRDVILSTRSRESGVPEENELASSTPIQQHPTVEGKQGRGKRGRGGRRGRGRVYGSECDGPTCTPLSSSVDNPPSERGSRGGAVGAEAADRQVGLGIHTLPLIQSSLATPLSGSAGRAGGLIGREGDDGLSTPAPCGGGERTSFQPLWQYHIYVYVYG